MDVDTTHTHDIKKEVRGYIIVLVVLMALTLLTVTVKYLHLQLKEAVAVALLIATIKGSLVACYFMHLITEKKLIYTILTFAALFLLGLVVLLLFGHHDVLSGAHFVS